MARAFDTGRLGRASAHYDEAQLAHWQRLAIAGLRCVGPVVVRLVRAQVVSRLPESFTAPPHLPVREYAEKVRAEFDIRSSSVGQTAASLSGGNKQKVVVAREVSKQPP